jgi:ribosomal protein S10
MQKAFADRKKHDKTTAKSGGRGIANSATDERLDKVDKAEAAALAIAEVAMVMQSNQEKQFEQMMKLFKEVMKTNIPEGAPLQAPVPAPTQTKSRKVCPHCKCQHSKPEKCWELEANAADCPANWKPVAERQSRVQS